MRSEGVDPKSMEGVLGDRAYHLAADHPIHQFPDSDQDDWVKIQPDLLLSSILAFFVVINVSELLCFYYSMS